MTTEEPTSQRARPSLAAAWLALLLAVSPAAVAEPLSASPPPPALPTSNDPESSLPEPRPASYAAEPVMASDVPHHHHGWAGRSAHRSPGLAFALSMTPVPVDFGNLYAENVPWGIAYTSAELAIGGGIVWVGADHMCHGGDCDDWSDSERAAMVALISGYVLVKLVAGTHASVAAQSFNEAHQSFAAPLIVPTSSGAVLGWQATF